MERLEGENLAELLRREGRLPPARARHVLLQAARALAEAHGRGIVHRDIKPENLFVAEQGGERDFLKVLDFGIAKVTAAGEAGAWEPGQATIHPERPRAPAAADDGPTIIDGPAPEPAGSE